MYVFQSHCRVYLQEPLGTTDITPHPHPRCRIPDAPGPPGQDREGEREVKREQVARYIVYTSIGFAIFCRVGRVPRVGAAFGERKRTHTELTRTTLYGADPIRSARHCSHTHACLRCCFTGASMVVLRVEKQVQDSKAKGSFPRLLGRVFDRPDTGTPENIPALVVDQV